MTFSAVSALCWYQYIVSGYIRLSEVTTCKSSFFSLSSWNLQLSFVTPVTSSFHGESSRAEGENEKRSDAAVCETQACMCVCVWLECQWTRHRVWEMRMFCTITTNVLIHYCPTDSICSMSIVWISLPLSLHVCGLIGTDVSAVQSISSSVCTTWPVKHADINMTCACLSCLLVCAVWHILAVKVAVCLQNLWNMVNKWTSCLLQSFVNVSVIRDCLIKSSAAWNVTLVH